MNREEFDNWAKDFGARFPQTRTWLQQIPDAKATVDVWRSVLADVTADEVSLVTMRLSAGDLPPIAAYEREQTAATIRRHVLEIRSRHTELENKRHLRNDGLPMEECLPRMTQAGFSCLEALRGIRQDMAGGMSKEDAQAKWLPETPNEQQPRYRCLDCKDSGLRKVWAIRSMTAAKENRLTRRNSYQSVTRCQCSKGGEQRFERLAEFNVLKWCEYGNGDWEAGAENLREFMADYAGNAAERMSNYQESFANY